MKFMILGPHGTVVAVATSAREARAKFLAGRAPFGRQMIVDQNGIEVSESKLEALRRAEVEAEKRRDHT